MRFFLSLLSLFASFALAYADAPALCQGEDALLAISDRPSIAYSACPVPKKTLYLESGYNTQLLIADSLGQQFPQSEVRYGLNDTTELTFFPPTYNTQRRPTFSGFGQVSFGGKQVLNSNDSHIWTAQAILGLPDGSQAYGSGQYNLTINSIYTHSLPHEAAITGIIGISKTSTVPVDGNTTFYSVNPIILFSPPTIAERFAPYVEFYGQSKLAPDENWGINFDAGILYLVRPWMTVDIVYGHRLLRAVNDVEQFFGGGFVIKLA